MHPQFFGEIQEWDCPRRFAKQTLSARSLRVEPTAGFPALDFEEPFFLLHEDRSKKQIQEGLWSAAPCEASRSRVICDAT